LDESQIVVPPSFIALFVPEGRIKPTAPREEIASRYELCEDLAQMLVGTARERMAELGIAQEDALQRIHRGLVEGTPAPLIDAAEALWVMRRLEELLSWQMPGRP
jgi:hypothetical protein